MREHYSGAHLRERGDRRPRRGGMLRTTGANTLARGAAVGALTLATVLVARVGGAADVGAYALIRILPGILAVVCVAGLPSSMAYFLTPARRTLPRLRGTLAALAGAGAALGCALWWTSSPLLATTFFPGTDEPWVAAAGLTVATQLVVTLGKTTLQGLQDTLGADLVIGAEEVVFLPAYVAVVAVGLDGFGAVVVALGVADLLVGGYAWHRAAGAWRRDAPAGDPPWGPPDLDLARTVAAFGMRGQVGGLLTLLNLRLDFLVLAALTGPAVVGTYAIASKYAELLRLPGTALTWVAYPRMAAEDEAEAARTFQHLLLPCLLAVACAAVPLVLLVAPVTRLLYGTGFSDVVLPAQILVGGMLLGGAAGLGSGYLYGRGRPGLNSVTQGLGLLVTLVLDLALIPTLGAVGAALASTTAYLVADLAVLVACGRLTHHARPADRARPLTLRRAS